MIKILMNSIEENLENQRILIYNNSVKDINKIIPYNNSSLSDFINYIDNLLEGKN